MQILYFMPSPASRDGAAEELEDGFHVLSVSQRCPENVPLLRRERWHAGVLLFRLAAACRLMEGLLRSCHRKVSAVSMSGE